MNSAVGTLLAGRTPLARVVSGFIAGAVAVVIAHQVMVLVLYLIGQIPAPPYSFRPNPWGVPQIINQMFWGGLWGILYAFLVSVFPGGWETWKKGLIFGLVVHVILGNWIVVALIRGQAMFAGLAPARMLIGALIGTAFGLGVAYLHAFMAGRRG